VFADSVGQDILDNVGATLDERSPSAAAARPSRLDDGDRRHLTLDDGT